MRSHAGPAMFNLPVHCVRVLGLLLGTTALNVAEHRFRHLRQLPLLAREVILAKGHAPVEPAQW